MKLKGERKIETIISIIVLLIGLIIFIFARQFPSLPEGHPGPGLFPSVIGVCIMLSGMWLFLSARQNSGKKTSLKKGNWVSVLLLLFLMVAFPFLKDRAGFFISISGTLLLVALLMRLSIFKALIVSIFTTGFIYLIFNIILRVPL